MRIKWAIFSVAFVLFLLSCNQNNSPEKTIYKSLEELPDSIQIGGITFLYGFKNQILAHKNGTFDSTYIENTFYKPNQYLFDSCFNFFSEPIYSLKEVKKWNSTYLKDYDSIVWKQTNFLITQNIDSLFQEHLRAVQEITGIEGNAKFLAYFPPRDYGISGGCDSQAMSFDLMYKIEDKEYLERVIPHEIEHTIYEKEMGNDPYFLTGIGVTIDEGLASFFEHRYLEIPETEILGSEEETSWLLENERAIFERLEPFFYKELDETCPLLYHFNRNSTCEPLISDTPTDLVKVNLGYFLGHRIVERYELTNGKDSWKDAYKLSPREFYERSGYKEHILN